MIKPGDKVLVKVAGFSPHLGRVNDGPDENGDYFIDTTEFVAIPEAASLSASKLEDLTKVEEL